MGGLRPPVYWPSEVVVLSTTMNQFIDLFCTTSVQWKMSNPQHSSGCGLRRAVGVWLYSIWIELKDLQ
jgi:hypothetical protein